jgi:hypothetical protein
VLEDKDLQSAGSADDGASGIMSGVLIFQRRQLLLQQEGAELITLAAVCVYSSTRLKLVELHINTRGSERHVVHSDLAMVKSDQAS